MTFELDSRSRNLLACFALATAFCGCKTPPSVDDGETGPECFIPDTGCPAGEVCNMGICDAQQQDDGNGPCDSEVECGTLEVCESNTCQSVGSPPACEQAATTAPPLEISEPVLALAFVDVDDDGAGELIVATQTQLHVYEDGATMPVSYPRGVESTEIGAMVGGNFDDVQGADVMVLRGDEFDLHASDGMGALATAVSMPSPYTLTRGFTAGAFDMDPTTDLLVWASFALGVQFGGGEQLDILLADITSTDARDLGLPGSGFSALRSSELLLFDTDGSMSGEILLRGIVPGAQAHFDVQGTPLEIAASTVQGWTIIEVFDRLTATLTTRWGLPENNVSYMRAGDLDGLDQIDEVAVIADGHLSMYVSNDCLLSQPLDEPAMDLVFGDHDGDGDDELAVLMGTNKVSLIDVE